MQSTIDESVPASSAALSSAPVRNNFAAAKADIERAALELTVSHQTPSSGDALTATEGLGCYELEPAGTIATLTIVTPPNAVDRQIFEITTTAAVTALTVSAASGQSVLGGSLLMSAHSGISYRFREADSTWRRRS
jgi:hypothetical protein